jgi:hypothetical protein
MNSPDCSTHFALLPPTAARFVLTVTVLAIAFCVAISVSPLASGFADAPSRGASDVDLYHAEVERIAGGESYYSAAGAELHERGYPTRSIFNWRTPLPMWLLGNLPAAILGRIIIGALAAMLLVVSLHVMSANCGCHGALLGGLMMVGALLPCWLDRVYVMPEVWAGVLIALSICTYAINRTALAFAAGLSALFIRELAAPYCIICFVLAVRSRRWREAFSWSAGFAVYAMFYAWHIAHVKPLILTSAHAHVGSWLQFGGAAFVISLAQMNAFLLLLPQWISAILLPLAMLGFAAWRNELERGGANADEAGKRPAAKHDHGNESPAPRAGLAACAYVVLFAFVGYSFNQYWGSLIAPLLCFGIARCPAAIHDLLVRSRLNSKEREPSPALASR